MVPEPTPFVDDKRYLVKYIYHYNDESKAWKFVDGLHSLRDAKKLREKYLGWHQKVVIFDTVTQSDVYDNDD